MQKVLRELSNLYLYYDNLGILSNKTENSLSGASADSANSHSQPVLSCIYNTRYAIVCQGNTLTMIKAILFDWDDVITLGSTKGYYVCYENTLKRLGIKALDQKEFYARLDKVWGQTYKEGLAALLQERPELVEEACAIYKEELFGDTYMHELYVLDGTTETLIELSKKYKLAIASGVHPDILKNTIMPGFNIPQVFSEMIFSYEISDPSMRKPHPYTAYELMKRLGVSPQETVVVGDAANDVLMAQRAHCIPVTVLTGHLNTERAQALGVKYIIPDVRALPEFLKTI